MAIRVRYNEPIFNQHYRGIPRDWNKGIHIRPNSPCCTYCHQIGHQINECSFIEDSVRQGFAEHFQNLDVEPARVGNHGHIEVENLYHERINIINRPK